MAFYKIKKIPPYKKADKTASYPFIFLHIPKSGGTTLDSILKIGGIYKSQSHIKIPISHYRPPVWIKEGWNGAWRDAKARADQLKNYGIISAHAPFGIHEFFAPEAKYITVLRDPVEREISNINFHASQGMNDIPKVDEIIGERILLDNPQTRMIAGNEAMSGKCTEETYNLALNNIENYFYLAGVTEKWELFLHHLLGIMELPAIAYTPQNTTEENTISFSDSERAAISNYHFYDMKLHKDILSRWEKHSISQIDPKEEVIAIPPVSEKNGKFIVKQPRTNT